jgi:serine acetyltransferase/GT2 family glycosyltransferase
VWNGAILPQTSSVSSDGRSFDENIAIMVNADTQPARLPISVVIPAYNSETTIARAVKSVLAQPEGFKPAEILVVDDHSTDRTAEIARELGARVIRHEINQGAASARNTAAAAASQPWLALLDADDEWLPNRLSALWPLRGSHVLVSGACVAHHEDRPGRVGEYAGVPSAHPQVLRSPGALIPQNFVMASATLVRRDVVMEVGGYDTTLRYAEDWDLWLRVLEHGTGLLSPEVVALYHRHGGQKSQHAVGPADTHRRIVAGCVGRGWWTDQTAARWDGLQWWLTLRDAVRRRDLVTSTTLGVQVIRHPGWLRAVATRKRRFRAWTRQTDRLAVDVREGRATTLRNRLACEAPPKSEQAQDAPGLRDWLLQDWQANRGLYWVQLFLVWFRLAQWSKQKLGRLAPIIVTPYWLITSLVLSVEFPATVVIGPRLRIFHLHGIVLHPQARIGADCVMRHGITIGNRVDRDGKEIGIASLGDGVDLGAGCAIVGDLHVGDHARVGALAVVLHSVPDSGIVVGNPARLVRVDKSE